MLDCAITNYEREITMPYLTTSHTERFFFSDYYFFTEEK